KSAWNSGLDRTVQRCKQRPGQRWERELQKLKGIDMNRFRTVLAALLALAAVAVGMTVASVASAPRAEAAGRDGKCDKGEFCYFYNSNNKGSISDFTESIDNYGTKQPSCYEFKGAGNGKGQCIKNNAASVWNRTGRTVYVYYNSNFGGKAQKIAPGYKGQLTTVYNENASHRIVKSNSDCKTDGTHSKLPTYILVYRVKLNRVDRVNFKDYVKNVLPNEWITSWKPASLRAGAIAVKHFGWYWALHSTRKTKSGECFDVYDNTNSQVYKPNSAVAATNKAVNDTWNKRMTRGGKILQAHYCATTTACGAWVDGDWMSQHGSQDQAKRGWNYQRILKHWYSN